MSDINTTENNTENELLKQLLAEIQELRQKINKQESSTISELKSLEPETIISSPTIIESPIQIEKNLPIAFIYSRIEIIPGIVKSINPDGTYDLEVTVPTNIATVDFKSKSMSFKRKNTVQLMSRLFPKARLVDPRTIFRKQVTALAIPQAGSGVSQTHIDEYVAQANLLRTPRFHDFHTSLIGTFFDPSPYVYNVYCRRGEITIQDQKFPPEEVRFPKNSNYYSTFSEAFNRFYKEHYKGMSKTGNKWHNVQIQVTNKFDI